jgi:prophage antirepressor-like protein
MTSTPKRNPTVSALAQARVGCFPLQSKEQLMEKEIAAVSLHQSRPFVFESHAVRVKLDEKGQPWFNANDVCTALEFVNPHKAVADHVDSDDLTKREVIDSIGRRQIANFINESGLYALILGSTKDAAKRFKRWVTSEVLPAIRKTGSYQTEPSSPAAFDIPKTLPDALRLAADLAEQKEKAEAELAIAAPKAQALDRIAGADGLMCVTNAAKTLGVRPKALFSWLQAHQWIYRRPGASGYTAYQHRIQCGLLEHKVTAVERPDGSEKIVERVLVTPKGLARLAHMFGAHQDASIHAVGVIQ